MRSNSGLITFHFSFFISLSLQLDGGNEDLSPSQHTSSSLVFSLFFSFHLLKIFLFRSFCLIFRLPSDHPICDHFFDFLPSSCELCVCLHSRVSSHHPRRSHPSSKSPTRIQNNVRLISLLHFNVAECLLNCYKARAMLCAPCPRLLCAHPPKAQTHFIFNHYICSFYPKKRLQNI